jgi:L-ascorbate metabolism protein UlaG (beta-lactamase superfamily)
MTVRSTHIGGPTALIEVGEVATLLTDPTFDPPAAATASAGAPAPES